MNTASKLILVFGFYMVAVGAGFLFAPAFILHLLTFPPAHDQWIRFMGLIIFDLGGYYIYCSFYNQRAFYFATVAGRMVIFAGAIALVLFVKMNPVIIAVASVDLFFALWTLHALLKEK
jgi:hypothetical protein